MSGATDSLVTFITSGMPGDHLEQLFDQPYAVVAILRSLPPLARALVYRVAATRGSVSAALVSSWAVADGDSTLAAAMAELAGLRLLVRVASDGQAVYALNASFQAQLQHAMCNGLLAWQGAVPPAAALPSTADLATYARQQWEALLLYLVRGDSAPPEAPAMLQATPIHIPGLLVAAGLMVKQESTREQRISQRGFQFLLADLYSQLWGIVRQYLSGLGAGSGGSADLATAVNFLLRLGLQEGSAAIVYSKLGGAECAIAAHMCQLGLLMPRASAGDIWLHPTRLAAVLAGGGRAGEAAAAPEEGYVIVESNFRVYAYTTSEVQVAVLRAFVRWDVLLPNLFVGTITRDSANEALVKGITAEQMVAFLRQHAHPRAAARACAVPAVVADQIRLWQQDLGRLQVRPTTVYSNFDSQELYVGAVAYARGLGAILYSNDDLGQLAVDATAHTLMREHLQERKRALRL